MSLSSQRLRLIAVLAGVNVALAAGGWLLLVSPQRHHAASTARQVQQAQDELARIKAASQPNAPQVKQPIIHTAALYALEEAMPLTPDQPDLLLALDRLAHSYGVRVMTLSPAPPTPSSGYSIQTVSLTLSGSYPSLTRFLHRLRTLVAVRHGKVVAAGRLFAVTSVTLADGTGKDLTATVSVQAFVFGGEDAATSTSTDSTDTTATTTTSGG